LNQRIKEIGTTPDIRIRQLRRLLNAKPIVCILESHSGLTGLIIENASVEIMEAMFLRRKLITNNIKINKHDYYNPNNVYIIDYSKPDFLEGIKDFLEKPFVPIDENILKSYSVESWIQRFIRQ